MWAGGEGQWLFLNESGAVVFPRSSAAAPMNLKIHPCCSAGGRTEGLQPKLYDAAPFQVDSSVGGATTTWLSCAVTSPTWLPALSA